MKVSRSRDKADVDDYLFLFVVGSCSVLALQIFYEESYINLVFLLLVSHVSNQMFGKCEG